MKLNEVHPVSPCSASFHEDRFRKSKWGLSVCPSVLLVPVMQFEVRMMEKEYVRPRRTDVQKFLVCAFREFHLPNELAIMTVIYLERLMAGGTELRQWNWKPILIAALLVASKIWEDVSSQNVDFCRVNPVYSLQAINLMEHTFADQIAWRFIVSPEEYAQVYDNLKQGVHSDLSRRVRAKRFG
jgi:hypothetical protein